MKKQWLTAVLYIISAATALRAQPYQLRVQAYIEQYKAMAIAEQRRTGIPAAITLAQGLLETQAGASELAANANNHFGIKCKKDWPGETYTYTDDAADECFRKYPSAAESYADHSNYLRKTHRYDSCFIQSPTDYAAWAVQLKKAGYATNPQYAARLIKIIEDNKLQQYTYAAMDAPPVAVGVAENNTQPPPVSAPRDAASAQPDIVSAPRDAASAPRDIAPQPAPQPQPAPPPGRVAEIVPEHDAVPPPPATTPAPAPATPEIAADDPIAYTGAVLHKNGLSGFYARKGDALLEAAIRNGIRYAKLLELNDLPDEPLEADMFIYLERRRSKGLQPTHTVAPGETTLQVAQAEGITIRALRDYNMLEAGEEPAPGAVLQLQQAAATKPATYRVASGRVATPAVQPAAVVPAAEITPPLQPVASSPDRPDAPAPAVPQEAAPVLVAAAPQTAIAAPAAAAPAAASSSINIANEPAVEEGPQDDFSRLKARLDKAVYADPKPVAAPALVPAVLGVAPPPAKGSAAMPATPKPVLKAAPTAAAAPAAAPDGAQFHVVKAGETAYAICRQHGLSMKQLMALNNLHFESIKVGQKLRLR